ncbi:contractile injection system protein, VgrG/Pvc8 family, partial [Pseudomonas sp. PSPC3-3]
MLFNQTSRLAKITSPLGPDVLLLNQMGGGEALGRLFTYDLQLTSLDANIDLNQLLGKPMSVGVQLADGGE